MKAPDPEGIPRIDVSTKELEALLEQAKQEPLREEGYHKLKAAIRTLGYVSCYALPAPRKPTRC
jgi:hypothetical protein